jgi:hypothetical protein
LTPEVSFLNSRKRQLVRRGQTSRLDANIAIVARQDFPVGANFSRRRQLRFKKLASVFFLAWAQQTYIRFWRPR